MDPAIIHLALGGLAVLGSIGLVFGIGLALAAHKFAVKANPKVEEVLEVLAGAQCGGCGFAGCEAYAEAVVHDADVKPSLCFPGKSEVAGMVAQITGKEAGAVANLVAAVRCSREAGKVQKKHDYLGLGTCTGATLAFAGPQACSYACVGFGDCAQACPFDAIGVVNGFPVVDEEACVGCGSCVRACSKHVFELVPRDARIWIPCSTRDAGKRVKSLCEAGCISCNICVRACPAKALSFVNEVIHVDYGACAEWGDACNEVCIEKCPRDIIHHFGRRDVAAAEATA